MAVIQTPEERFANLVDFPYEPHYVEVNGLRMHYVDEGSGETILCLHGEPTWSYLYRKMIPPLSAGHRVVAPDFIGFGRSDKPTEMEDYSFQMHRDMLAGFLEALDLKDITLVCQDWGGLIGLRVAAELPERFYRLVIMNTGLPTGDGQMTEGFKQWLDFVKRTPDLPIGMIIERSLSAENVDKNVLAAYEAPFPDAKYKAGAQSFPLLVPITPDDPASDSMRAARDTFSRWDKPVLVMFSDGDPVTRGGERFFRKLIPTAMDQPEIEIKGAGHFLQEDKGEEIAEQILAFIERTPLP